MNLLTDLKNRDVIYWKCLTQLVEYINSVRQLHPYVRFVATSLSGDILHSGHLACLNESKSFGHYLIVLVDSDEYLIWKKGYVVLPFEHRVELLKNLRSVDHLLAVPFNKENPTKSVTKVLESLPIQVWAKGGDRIIGFNIEEFELCQSRGIIIQDGVGGYDKKGSSSSFIEKVYECIHKKKLEMQH